VLANDTSTSTPGVSPGTIYWTQDVTLSATVTASGTPVEGLSGPVYFYIDDSYVGYANVDASGVATFTVSNVPAGSHAVTAAFQGDGVFEPSTSAASSLTVLTNGSSISTPSVSPSTIYWTQDVTLSATVTPSGTPVEGLTGPVYFYVDDGYVGYANVDTSGVATLTVSNVPAGSHAVIAAYQGDGVFEPSTSAASSLTVLTNDATVTLTSSLNPAYVAQSVTFTVNVAPSGGTPFTGPTGTIYFYADGAYLGSDRLVSGAASFTTSSLPVGSLTIRAEYSGDGIFEAASGTLTQVVNGPVLTLSGASSIDEGDTYTLSLSAGAGTISSWTIDWNDGSAPETFSGNPSSVTHVYAEPGSATITGTATDENGTWNANAVSVAINNLAPSTPTLRVMPTRVPAAAFSSTALAVARLHRRVQQRSQRS